MVAWRKGRVMAEAETAVSQPQPREAQGCWEQQEPGVGRQGSHPGPSGSTARHPLSLHCYFQNLLSVTGNQHRPDLEPWRGRA